MSFPVLNNYLARLSEQEQSHSRIWLDAQGHAQGRFFNCTMTSAFQPVRELDRGKVVAYEGLARGVSAADQGLSLWKLLDHAASDDESIELDRLCRMLHAINFFRQHDSGGADLYLNVHDRLLSAVSSNHGYAFQRILDALGLPIARIVLLLPPVTARQDWLLSYVADNYRRNGFRFAVNVDSARQSLHLLERVRPDVLRLDARDLRDTDGIVTLLGRAQETRTRVVFRRLETPAALLALQDIGEQSRQRLLGQGFLLDRPSTVLLGEGASGGAAPVAPA